MRILFMLPDLDGQATKGYQVRTLQIASWLASRHTTLLVTAATSSRADRSLASTRRPAQRLAAAIMALVRAWPLQSALFDGVDVANAARRLVREWMPDVVVVITERMPATTIALAALRPTLLDVVDAQQTNMAQRARQADRFRAWLWRRESRAFARLAGRLSEAVAAVSVSAERELVVYPQAVVIRNGATATAAKRPPPEFDVVFTGNLSYWPNVEAVEEMCNRVLPLLRLRIPKLRVAVAGRRPVAQVVAACTRADVQVLANVPDMDAVLRRSRLALAPLLSGTGSQLKLFEAIAAGTPVLAYPAATVGLSATLPTGVFECAGPDAMATLAGGLLNGDDAIDIDATNVGWEGPAEAFEVLLKRLNGTYEPTAVLQTRRQPP